MSKGWRKESARHSLAARGVKTKCSHRPAHHNIPKFTTPHFLSPSVEKQLLKLARHYNEYGGVISDDGSKILVSEEGTQMVAPPIEKFNGNVIFHTHSAHDAESLDSGWSLLDIANFYRNDIDKFVLAEDGEIFVLEKGAARPTEKEIWKAWFAGVYKQNKLGDAEFIPLAMMYVGPNKDAQKLNHIMSENVLKEFQKKFKMKSYHYRPG